MIVRPPEYLEDVRERELEVQAAEARLHDLDSGLCPHCDYRIERDFIRCPSCLRKLKERCVSCQRPLDQAWTICPYCETEVPGVVAPARRKRRSRREAADEESLLIEHEPSLTRDVSLSAQDITSEGALPAATPAGGASEDDVRTKPVAATEQAASRSRSSGRARRPRPTS
jgi:RNA polymerase subunit RPABC4/transcription elongation factor Spt4